MDYIDHIRKAREARGISQRKFSKMLGLSGTAYGHYEGRRRQMEFWTFVKICVMLDLSADEILGLDDLRKKYRTENQAKGQDC